ncbi:DUF1232 domain-containing protein [Deinococcus multiflagellatus]|uniref:DUF1232 domain-containing protein n=1 Tax=Deinococcus multiflagellatus TaxID=1656887 RepID=A0ABW1ZNZ6_9DEIO|nr:DUF1232 domain-containing protein [Deinococcus multiflagellatus]MBZ9713867.1 DUF1232 domain-containing protein [Deinococcus multiflagellatus]
MIKRIRAVWRDALALLFALGDRQTPTSARLLALGALAYALLPLDLLPDLTPVLGLADDALVVPGLLALAARTLPAPVYHAAQGRSLALQRRLPWLVPAVVLGALGTAGLLGWALWQALAG